MTYWKCFGIFSCNDLKMPVVWKKVTRADKNINNWNNISVIYIGHSQRKGGIFIFFSSDHYFFVFLLRFNSYLIYLSFLWVFLLFFHFYLLYLYIQKHSASLQCRIRSPHRDLAKWHLNGLFFKQSMKRSRISALFIPLCS